MKVWPIDPLVPRNLRLEVPEKLPQVTSPTRSAVAVATVQHLPCAGILLSWRYQQLLLSSQITRGWVFQLHEGLLI